MSRTVGKGWAALVLFLDFFKGLGPMLLAAQLLEPAGLVVKHAVLGAVGAAAIVGHVKMALGFALAMAFFRDADDTIGQWTPILSLTILPFLTLAANAWLDLTLFDGVTWVGTPGRCRSSCSRSLCSSWPSTSRSRWSGWARSARSRELGCEGTRVGARRAARLCPREAF